MSKQKSFLKGPAIRQSFQSLMFGEDGAVLVEATIIVPILVVMSIYVMDFGLIFYNKTEVTNAAQAGAQWAVANRVYNCDSVSAAAQQATQFGGVTVNSMQFCGCSKVPVVPPAAPGRAAHSGSASRAVEGLDRRR